MTSADTLSADIRALRRHINYYKRLMKIGTLNEKQQNKYDELMRKLDTLEANKHVITEEEEKAKIIEYIEANKQRAKQRYQRNKSEDK